VNEIPEEHYCDSMSIMRQEIAALKAQLAESEKARASARDGLDAAINMTGPKASFGIPWKARAEAAERERDEAQQDARQMFSVFKDIRAIVKSAGRSIGVEQLVAVFAPLRWEPQGQPPPKWLDPLVEAEQALAQANEKLARAKAEAFEEAGKLAGKQSGGGARYIEEWCFAQAFAHRQAAEKGGAKPVAGQVEGHAAECRCLHCHKAIVAAKPPAEPKPIADSAIGKQPKVCNCRSIGEWCEACYEPPCEPLVAPCGLASCRKCNPPAEPEKGQGGPEPEQMKGAEDGFPGSDY
jgi:hypothetical protein